MILKDNLEQMEQVRALLLSNRNFYVDDVVIMECVYVLTKEGYPRSEIADYLQTFLLNPMVTYAKSFFDPIFKSYVSHPSLSFEDLLIAAHAEQKSFLPLYTFDKKLASQTETAELIK